MRFWTVFLVNRRVKRYTNDGVILRGEILIYRDVYGYAKGSKKGTGNREQGTGKAAHGAVQPSQSISSRDKMRRGIPENPVAAT